MNELDILTDTLNEVLERAEVVLAKHRVTAWVESDEFKDGRKLGLKKSGKNNWKLVWAGNGVTVSVLDTVLNSSRESRLIAAEHIPKLHEAVMAKKSDIAVRMRTAVENLERFVETLEKEDPDRGE